MRREHADDKRGDCACRIVAIVLRREQAHRSASGLLRLVVGEGVLRSLPRMNLAGPPAVWSGMIVGSGKSRASGDGESAVLCKRPRDKQKPATLARERKHTGAALYPKIRRRRSAAVPCRQALDSSRAQGCL